MTSSEPAGFLRDIPPFDRLPDRLRAQAAEAMDAIYSPTGSTLAEAGQAAEVLWVVLKGTIREVRAATSVAVYGPGDVCGASGLVEGAYPDDLITADEVIAYVLPRSAFESLAQAAPEFLRFFQSDIATKRQALAEGERGRALADFMVDRIDSAYLHEPLFVDGEQSIHAVATAMETAGVTAALIRDGDALGLVSQSSIYRAVAIRRLDLDEPVRRITRYGLIGLDRGETLFNAMLTMTRHGISRIVVTEAGRTDPVGVLEQSSLMSFFASHNHLVNLEIQRAGSVVDLRQATARRDQLVQSLFAKGVRLELIQRLVTELNAKIYQRLFELLAPAALQADSCLIVMGSEGRGEQVLSTDQDNGLILRDDHLWETAQVFAQSFRRALESLGYPPCPGDIMVTNPQWCRSLQGFKAEIHTWLNQPGETGFLNLAILVDASPVAGANDLLADLKRYLQTHVTYDPAYLSHFAKPVLAFETPLGLLAGFKTDRQGGQRGLDIKKGGLFPIIHGIRSLTLEAGVTETNTQARIRALQDRRLFEPRFADDLAEALDFLGTLRLERLLMGQTDDSVVDTRIDPQRLNRMERDLLRDALRIADELKRLIHHHFRLAAIT